MLFQYCCSVTKKKDLKWLKEKYGDRLGLPLTMAFNSPLRLSIAHRHHGFGMLSGWESESPLDVQERIDNDQENNMLIESWYVNSSKFLMAKEYYDKLDGILRDAKITNKEIYNPGTPAQTPGVTLAAAVQEEDEFEGGQFDDNATEQDSEGTGDSGGAGDGGTTLTGDDGTTLTGDGDATGGQATSATAQGDDQSGDSPPSAFAARITTIMEMITQYPVLIHQLCTDDGLRELLAQLQGISDNAWTNPMAEEECDECIGKIQEQYITPAIMGTEE
ncbi:hypothetical protein DOTSEDRAFT_56056 [Dothistroma septosporum NZE10]|uniref:Uncharacterized protein n=1 Tax=Dothistroma septosporum (strain NZE10 / CBS 128990) TaxID=675120 RepID=N1PF39_DOTSN|nr:hypothetical protein DOTSEDRAFT_56056 [Dothistroma septosporum NZE10]